MSKDPKDVVGQIVMLRTTDGRDHSLMCVEGYYDQPTFTGIRCSSGERYCWAATLTREATPEEKVWYWRQRALAAEAKR